MSTVPQATAQPWRDLDGQSISVPMGLLGFEKTKRFILQAISADDPLCWLEVADNPGKGFYVLCPGGLVPGYAPEYCSHDLEFLGIQESSDAVVLNLVMVGADGSVRALLKAPIVVNRRTRVGKQVVPNNIDQLPAECPLDMHAAMAA